MRRVSRRIIALYFLGVVVFFAARSIVVPPTFGETGWFRNESVSEIASLETKIAGSNTCIDCHVAEYAEWSVGEHKNVSCESCHGLLKAHVANPEANPGYMEFMSPESYNSTIDFCLSCHEKDASKPPTFPQVSVDHTASWNCLRCHSPHNPVIG